MKKISARLKETSMKFRPVLKQKMKTWVVKDANGNESKQVQPVKLPDGRPALVETYEEIPDSPRELPQPPVAPKEDDYEDAESFEAAVIDFDKAMKAHKRQLQVEKDIIEAAEAKRRRRRAKALAAAVSNQRLRG